MIIKILHIYTYKKNKKLYNNRFVFLINRIIFAPSLEKYNDQLAQLVEHLPFKEMASGFEPQTGH